jgi:hypothetical protein
MITPVTRGDLLSADHFTKDIVKAIPIGRTGQPEEADNVSVLRATVWTWRTTRTSLTASAQPWARTTS